MVIAKYADVASPSDISCSTPPLSSRFELEVPHSPSTPHSLVVPERLFFNINRYLDASFCNKIWVEDDDGKLVNTSTRTTDPGDLNHFYNYCFTGGSLARSHLFVEARRILSKACSLVKSILKGEDPRTVDSLLDIVLYLIETGYPEIVTQLIGYISRMSKICLNAEHPWGQICKLMGSIEPGHIKETMKLSWERTLKVYRQHLGQFHEMSLLSQIQFIESSYIENLSVAEQRLRVLQSQFREAVGNFSTPYLHILMALSNNLYHQAKYGEAESVGYELWSSSQENGSCHSQVDGLEFIAISQYRQGKTDLAELNLREAFELIGQQWDSSNVWVLQKVARLEKLLLDCGLEQKASELKTEIERMMLLGGIADE